MTENSLAPYRLAVMGDIAIIKPRHTVKPRNHTLAPTATAASASAPSLPAMTASAKCMPAIDRLLTIRGLARRPSLFTSFGQPDVGENVVIDSCAMLDSRE